MKKIKQLKYGDIVIDRHGDYGIVSKIDTTLLHEHKYIKIKFLTYTFEGIKVSNLVYFEHHPDEFKVVGNAKDNFHKGLRYDS